MNLDLEDTTTLFTLNQVPVKARPSFWLMPPLLAGILAWIAGRRRPARGWPQRLLVGVLGAPLAIFADVGHALGHSVSARLAGGPMEAILLGADMPRTLYPAAEVAPRVHILRSVGGPLTNFLGLLVSLLWRRAAPPASLSRELAETSAVTHALLAAGSFFPLPILDGGVILKWSLVARGYPPAQAGQVVNRASTGMGLGALGAGALLLLAGRRLLGALLAAAGLLAVAAGRGKLK